MKEIKFNVNDFVKVKLTKEGLEIVKKYYYDFDTEFRNYNLGDGWYKFQFHELAHIFGKYMYNGNSLIPFETNFYFIIEER